MEERKCEHLADAGFFAFAVDLYGKGIRGKNAKESLKLMNDLCSNRSLISSRINHCLDLLKNHKRVDKNNTAAIGYCFGGKCVLDLARSGAELNLIVSFHGIYDKPDEDSSKFIKTPILILHGDEDPYATRDDLINLIIELKEKKAKWFVHEFGGVDMKRLIMHYFFTSYLIADTLEPKVKLINLLKSLLIKKLCLQMVFKT